MKITAYQFSVVLVLIFLLISKNKGCHNARHEGDEWRRKKRQTRENSLEDFFAICLQDRIADDRQYTLSIVDYTIRQSSWFEQTDSNYCSADSVDCWRDLTNFFLSNTSDKLTPIKDCVEDFGAVNGQIAVTRDINSALQLQPVQSTVDVIEAEFIDAFRSQLPSLGPDDHSVSNLNSVIELFRNDVVCRLDFCDCSGAELPSDENCGDTWYSRLVGSTKLTSPLRQAVVFAANTAISNAIARYNANNQLPRYTMPLRPLRPPISTPRLQNNRLYRYILIQFLMEIMNMDFNFAPMTIALTTMSPATTTMTTVPTTMTTTTHTTEHTYPEGM